jgi:hypothetical protein
MAAKELLCAQCAGKGKTCCQGTEVYVTLGDVGRIRQQTERQGFLLCGLLFRFLSIPCPRQTNDRG